jgi:hypothetical protein
MYGGKWKGVFNMLRNLNEILNYVLLAEDGEIGRCRDFLYDDLKWTIRYMVADTRKWLPGRKVLIAPASLGEPDWCTNRFQVMLKRHQIEASPPLDEHAPVSRRYEITFNAYYRTSPYWAGASDWGTQPSPSMLQAETDKSPAVDQRNDRLPYPGNRQRDRSC